MTLWARICNVILPVSVYWLIMTLGRKPGKTIWILFPFVFFAAFQLVLLYLFGRSIIAVDMFLNLTTTNSGEALELLDNLLPAVIGVFVVYIPALVLGGFHGPGVISWNILLFVLNVSMPWQALLQERY